MSGLRGGFRVFALRLVSRSIRSDLAQRRQPWRRRRKSVCRWRRLAPLASYRSRSLLSASIRAG